MSQAKISPDRKTISSQIPAQNTRVMDQPMESKLTSVEYRKPPGVINATNRFTKVPPPRYRPHQPPSAQKKPSFGISQQKGTNVMPDAPHTTLAGNHQPSNRSSFGGIPSNPSTSKGLKPNVRYGKSLSAESVLFTETMGNEGTEFIEIPNETIPARQHQFDRNSLFIK